MPDIFVEMSEIVIFSIRNSASHQPKKVIWDHTAILVIKIAFITNKFTFATGGYSNHDENITVVKVCNYCADVFGP
jgi:hypothetical protein